MPSPFPGMNPYLERPNLWRGFHGLMLAQMTYALTRAIQPHFYVEYEEALHIDESEDQRLFGVAHVAVSDADAEAGGGVVTAARTAVKPLTRTIPLGLG